MNITPFLSEFTHGFQMSNRFRLQVRAPLQLAPTLGASARQGSTWAAQGLVCANARTPDRSFDTTNMDLYGITEKFPTHMTFTDTSFTFLCPLKGSDNAVLRFFQDWQQFIQRQTEGNVSRNFRFPQSYYGGMSLSLYTSNNFQEAPTMVYDYHNVYPITLDSSNLQWGYTDEFASITVQFAYSYWTAQPSA